VNVLIFNQDWFAAELRQMGHFVVTAGMAQHLDVRFETPLMHVQRIIEEHMPQNHPDVILVHDNSAPIMFQGLDETPIPTVFYSVDAHHHADLHKYLANVFDYTLIAQKDYAPSFEALGNPVEWMPLWASRHIEPSSEKQFQAVFVGTLNANLNPDRVHFFEALKEKAPVHVQCGCFWEIFPYAEIVINQTVKGDLNFRVFEAMMSGATLLTEYAPNGLLELFRDGEHLVTYRKNNVDEAAEKIKSLLTDKVRCRAIGAAGRAEILARHLPIHRAARIEAILKTVKKKRSRMKFFSMMLNFASLAVKMQKIDTAFATRAFLAALKAADYALKEGEDLNDELACFVAIACVHYEKLVGSGAAETLLMQLGAQYPTLESLALARIRALLNKGKVFEAENIARAISTADVYDTFCRSEQFIGELLAIAGK
jgi:hypothetical protein